MAEELNTAAALTAARAPQAQPLPDAVQWWEGMLLAPQHLQQSDVYWQQQLRYRIAQLTPCYWGVSDLEVDGVKLADGSVAVQRLECVMPDGTPVVFPGTYGDSALELDVSARLPRGGTPLRISLLMPRQTPEGGSGALARHDVVEGEVVIDANPGGGAVAVDRLRPRIVLWAGASVPAHYQVCPLFELVHRIEAQRCECTAYHPPMLRMSAADFLGRHSLRRRVRSVNDALWLKLRELGGDRRDDGAEDGMALGGEAMRQLSMARRLAAVLPRLGLLSARPEAGAMALYDVLAEVAGAMASFGANPIVPVFDAYRHDDCEPQFGRALAYIERKLGYIDSRHELLAFERVSAGRFRRALGASLGPELIVELRTASSSVPSAAERHDLTRWLSNACIAAEALHESARRARVSARVRPLTADECAQRHLRVGAALFLIENATLDLPDTGRHALLAAAAPLVIEGLATDTEPSAVLLVQPHAPPEVPYAADNHDLDGASRA